MPSHIQSAVGNRTWRQKGPAAPAGGGKMLPRIVSTLFGIGLMVLLVWLIWWWFFLPKTYFATLPIVDYGVLAVPPIPFAREDSEAFAGLGPPDRTVNLGDFEISKNIAELSQGLHKLAMHPRDVLILSLDAQGVSDDGIAYLLASDFFLNPNSPNAGRFKLSDLLGQIRESPARTKLLILDANHLAYDPRLGMAANEFPRLLEEEVKKLNDPALWVLTSAGPLQLSQNSAAEKRSIFSQAVTEGLRGAADGNRNGTVDLGELFLYVRREVPKLATQITPEAQSPRLLHGGEGLADPPAKITLASYSAKKSSADPQEKSPPDKQLLQDRATFKKTLEQAWTLRDKIQDRTQGDGWTPIDYAPHLWREFQELLLGYERRYRSGTAFDAKKLAAELQKELDAWNENTKNADSQPSPEIKLVLNRLASARYKFLQTEAKKRLDAADEQTIALKKALHLKNDLVFWTPFYVRWHAGAARLSEQPHPLYQPLGRMLDKLGAFCKDLEDRRPSSDANIASSENQGLENEAEELVQMHDGLKNQHLDAELQNLLDAPKKTPRPKSAIALSEALLATPLLSAPKRSQLLDIREKLETPLSPAEATEKQSNLPSEKNVAIPNWRWQRLFEQAELDRKLVLLADPAQNISLPKEISQAGGVNAENSNWLALRQFGKQLGDFYAALPGRINGGLDAADQATLRPIERLLRAVDARDVELIDAQNPEQTDVRAIACAVPLLPEMQKPANRLTLVAEKSLELPRKGWLPFSLTLQNSLAASGVAKVTPQFDGDLLEIVNPENNQPLRPGKQFTIALSQELTKPLKLQARAKRQSDFKTNVEFEAVLGDQSARTAMNLRLAPPDVVDLTILAFGYAIKQSSPSADRMRLWPYPNRTTNYSLALTNHSGRARKVLVELYALQPPPRGERESKESPLDTSGKPKSGLISLAGPEPIEVSLPADDSPVKVVFPEPKPPAGEKDKPKEPDKPKADKPGEKPEEKAKPAVELTYGMVCVIRDAETKEPRWIKRIDCSPRKPRDYLEPVVRYDAAHGRITIDVAAEEKWNPPPISGENPLKIVWANAGESTAAGAVIDRVSLTEPEQAGVLSADVESAPGKKVWVQLTVDDDPRAFVYHVPCDNNDSKPVDAESDRVAIRIASPPNDRPFRVPLAEPIPLELQVDAPEDAFLNEADSVQLMIVADGSDRELCPEEHRWFYSDRQVKVFLNELSPTGELKIGTKVSDFKIPLGVGGVVNTRARIMGQISVNNPNLPEQRILLPATVRILLQGEPPSLKDLGVIPDRAIPKGQPINAYVTVRKELSAIKEMQIGIDRDNSGVLEASEKPLKLHQADDTGKWQAKLPTDDLEPGRYTLAAKAVDVLGFETQPLIKTIVIDRPPPPPKTATMSNIAGRVVDQDGHPLARIRITLQGANLTATSDASGNFSFKDVPHGKYKMEAKGIVIGSERKAEQEITLPGASDPVQAEIRMVW